jgi:hypothetical protein
MAEKKTTKVGMIKHQGTGMTVQLNVDRDSRLFWADLAGERIEHAEGNEVERLILEKIEAAMTVPWTPFIFVMPWNHNSTREYVIFGFHAKRAYYANLPAGVGLRQARWDAKDDKQRLAWSEGMTWRPSDGAFVLPAIQAGYSGEKRYYLPYSEAVWDRLMFLQTQIVAAGATLATILGSPNVMAELAAMPAQLTLPEPTATVND